MGFEELVDAIACAPRGRCVTVDEIMRNWGVERKEAVEALKRLGDKGFGRYFVGRGSNPTRLEWKASPTGDNEEVLFSRRHQDAICLDYVCPLDNNRDARLRLPRDLSQEEAEHISQFVQALVRRRTEGG